jgi:hypothetical protein
VITFSERRKSTAQEIHDVYRQEVKHLPQQCYAALVERMFLKKLVTVALTIVENGEGIIDAVQNLG